MPRSSPMPWYLSPVVWLVRLLRDLWPVARETFTECVRTKVAAVFVLLLAVSLVGPALTIEGDGTLKGRIQTFLAYASSLVQLELGLATVLLAIGLVTEDIRAKTIFLVATKPLRRLPYVLGRWLGVVLLAAAALGVAAGLTYGLGQHLRSLPTETELGVQLGHIPKGRIDLDRLAVENEVFAARAAHKPDPFQVKKAAERRYDRLVEERGADALIREKIRNDLARARRGPAEDTPAEDAEVERRLRDPELRKQIVADFKSDLEKQLAEELQIVRPGRGLRLRFSGLSPASGRGQTVQVRYRLRPIRGGSLGQEATLHSNWRFLHPEIPAWPIQRTDPKDQATSIMVGSEGIAADGTLTLIYVNDPRTRTAVKLDPADVTVLQAVATFEGSFLRANLLILIRLAFLAAAGVLFAGFLSFPVACLSCMILLLIAVMSNFILEATALSPRAADPSAFDYYSHYLVRGMFKLLPQLPLASSPADALVDGTNIGWAAVATEAGTGAGLRALAAVVVGWLIFRRRELARVQV